MILRYKKQTIEVDDNTAELIFKHKDTIKQMVEFWDRHMEFMKKNKNRLHRPRVVDFIANAMLTIYSGSYNDMPKRCENYFEGIKEKTNPSMRFIQSRIIRYGDPMVRQCIEAYISKQYDKMSREKQAGRRVIKYTRNKYKLTKGSFYNAKRKLGWL